MDLSIGDSGTINGCSLTITPLMSSCAAFTPQQFTLTVTRAGSGSGTVTSSPSGLNCGGTCQANYNGGTTVMLTAIAAAGAGVAGVSGRGGQGAVAPHDTGRCGADLDPALALPADHLHRLAGHALVPPHADAG